MQKVRKPRLKNRNRLYCFAQGESLSRRQAVERVCACLRQSDCHPDVQSLIQLFDIEPEELAEAGVGYETLKLLERQALFI